MFSIRAGRIFALAFIILIILVYQLKNDTEVIIDFKYTPGSGATTLYYVNVVSGKDKFHWYDIAPSQIMSITLYPGELSTHQVTVFYQFTKESVKQIWNGPKFKIGKGYRMHILLNSNQITTQSCNLPCRLPPI